MIKELEENNFICEGKICDSLNSYFINNCRYKLANGYIFKSDWESDFFVQKQNGYSYEFEVKISRSDYFSDKNKITKHSILKTGAYNKKSSHISYLNGIREVSEETEIVKHNFRPNKFFYVVPSGMITESELPDYAGLFYYEGDIYKGNCGLIKIKDAPFIHREKLDFEKVLCSKFYNYWLNAKNEIRILKKNNQ